MSKIWGNAVSAEKKAPAGWFHRQNKGFRHKPEYPRPNQDPNYIPKCKFIGLVVFSLNKKPKRNILF